MSGNREGGLKTAQTNRLNHGADFYARIGALGGAAKVPKGFAKMSAERLSAISAKGGTQERNQWTKQK